jgi:membrane-associated phospholipid phosphatase
MNNNLPEPVLPESIHSVHWITRQRRPLVLLLLGIALVLTLVFLPESGRTSLWNALVTQRGLVLLLAVFALVTVSLIWSAGQRLDMRIFQLLNLPEYPGWLDRAMWITTQLGNMLVAFLLALLLFILNYRRLAVEIVLGTLSLWLLVELIKTLSDRQRPFHSLDNARVIGWRERGRSFPSGHTSQIFFLMTLMIHSLKLGLWISVALYALAALVGLTRIYVGAHYPRDVLAGIVLGSAWGLLAMLVDGYWLFLYF